MGVIQPLFTAAFIDPSLGKLFFIVGMVIVVIGGIRGLIWRNTHFAKYFKSLVLRGVSFLLALFLFKGPWIAVSKIINNNFEFKDFVKSTLLASNVQTEKEAEAHPRVFLAQNSENLDLASQSDIDLEALQAGVKDLNYEQCLLEHDDPMDLESTKQKAPGSAIHEDVGRYVGYAWREFKKTGVGGGLLKLLFRKNNNCFGRDHDGLLLCQHREEISKQNFEALKTLALQLSKQPLLNKALKTEKSPALQLLENLLEKEKAGEDLRDAYKALETYYQEHSILTTESSVMIPYRYIVPLNVVFNWSLQNLSSYYTDIGLIWLAVFILMLGGLGYAVVSYDSKHKQLLFLSFATVIGWAIWWAIGGGIVWYGLGLMIWSILTLIALLQEWESKEEKELNARYLRLLGLFVVYMAIQGLLNAVRIASQASEGPFAEYKSNVSQTQWITDELEYTIKTSYSFDAQDIFALQFGQYQPFMEAVAQRKDEEGVLIAGTYLQYFLKNQKNLRMDGMLTRLREEMSDFNSCRAYQRLKNEKLKYLVIDPNIGTVGRAGEGNESLFHRFFARLSADEQKIQTHGALTMLMKMAQEGYIKLIYTNNLGAKYAFELSDEELQTVYGVKSQEELLLLRSKMAVAKFFYEEEELLDGLFRIFQARIMNGQGLSDIGNILGKKLDEAKMFGILQTIFKKAPQGIKELSQDERQALTQYILLYRALRDTSGKGQEALIEVFQRSLF